MISSKFSSYLILLLTTTFILSCTYETIENNLCDTAPAIDAVNIVGTECGKATGSIEVVSSSETSLTFSIDDGAFQDSNFFANLVAKSYTITVKDEAGCTTSQTETVENLNGINIQVNSSPSGCDVSNGTISVIASGGPEPYTFILNNSITQGNSLFTGLAPGSYTVSAVDSDGCSVEQSVDLTSGQSFASIKTIITTNCAISSCHGGSISPDLRNNQNINTHAARIAIRTGNGSMPPAGKLTATQIKEIACWVNDGATIN